MATESYHTPNDKPAPPLPLKQFVSPPPDYADATSIRSSKLGDDSLRSSKVGEQVNVANAPWLLRRTSIHVSSEAADGYDDDKRSISQMSMTSTKTSTKDGGLRQKLFKNQHNHRRQQESVGDAKSVASWQHTESFDTGFGTKVSIEAGRPVKEKAMQRHDMRGLEQAASVKRWAGGGKPGEAWGKLQKDPEIWDPSGDTLVYFGYQRPAPSFRIRSALIEEVGSDILTSKLHEGLRRTATPSVTSGVESSLRDMNLNDRPDPPRTSARTSLGGRPSPRRSNSGAVSIASEASADASDAPVRYQIHFPAPDGAARLDLLRYHITTRNFFALLLSRPLVGLTFYQALVDLHERLRLYLPGDPNCALIIIRCLMENNLHNVCGDPAAAAGLLAWSEDEEICWQEGWREGFVHCSGMYLHLRTLPEFRDVSHTSRTLLERAHLERQVRIQEVEDHLFNFDFPDLWPENTLHLKTIRTSFDHMRKFLKIYYEKAYKTWPPKPSKESGDDAWLTRTIATRLQNDFDALYDYFVDKTIVWTPLHERTPQNASLIRSTTHSPTPIADDAFLAEALKRFDHKNKQPPIPHPYPLFPTGLSPDDTAKQHKSSLFSSKSKALEKRIALAYAEASNLPQLTKAADFAANGLVDAFVAFEKSDRPTEAEPRAARKGRWMLLYGVLQTLARVSVDSPDLYFAADVPYFLNPRLKGTPPWSYGGGAVYEEAQVRLAHCWRDFGG